MKNKFKKIVAMTMAAAMVTSIMATSALAATYYLEDGSVTIGSDDQGTTVTQGESTKNDSEIVISQKDSSVATKNTITVEAGVGTKEAPVTITLDDVNIDVSSKREAAISIGDNSEVIIELDGDNKVKSGSNHAGVELNGSEANVTITDSKKETDAEENVVAGSLTATGGDYGAGIGTGNNKDGGDITITGGAEVTATGGRYSAGIGAANRESIGDITISDEAVVNAYGANYGAGIGSANGGNVGKITIDNATVEEAVGGKYAAGIGAGNNSDAPIDITITDSVIGTLNEDGTMSGGAKGGYYGAGIGGGSTFEGNYKYLTDADYAANTTKQHKAEVNVTIENSQINAVGGQNGAGIGSGSSCYNTATINISGNDTLIYATSDASKANGGDGYSAGSGIGGRGGKVVVNISGGTIYAKGGKEGDSAGIGGGQGAGQGYFHNGDGVYINISGGTVVAVGGPNGAGIGGGGSGKVASIIISGGKINAAGGNTAAGIGAGGRDDVYDIIISGGDIAAEGGELACGIGGALGYLGNVTITGGKIVAKSGTDGRYKNYNIYPCAIGPTNWGPYYNDLATGDINDNPNSDFKEMNVLGKTDVKEFLDVDKVIIDMTKNLPEGAELDQDDEGSWVATAGNDTYNFDNWAFELSDEGSTMTISAVWTKDEGEQAEEPGEKPGESENPGTDTPAEQPEIVVEPEVEEIETTAGTTTEVEIEENQTPLAGLPEIIPDPAELENTFEDVAEEAEYRDAVVLVAELGLMDAAEDGAFAPEEAATCDVVMEALFRMDGTEHETVADWAADNGMTEIEEVAAIVEALDEGKEITRAELATIVYCFVTGKVDAESIGDLAEIDLTGFADIDEDDLGAYVAEAVKWAVSNGYLSTDEAGMLNLSQTVTRAEVAVLLARIMESMVGA